MRDLRPLAKRPLPEALEAMEAWSIPSTPGKEQLLQPSQGLELSEASRRAQGRNRCLSTYDVYLTIHIYIL